MKMKKYTQQKQTHGHKKKNVCAWSCLLGRGPEQRELCVGGDFSSGSSAI